MLNITRESKAFQGPWTTLVKGRGLGAITKNFDQNEATKINKVIAIVEKLAGENQHNAFAKELCQFILDFNNPNILFFQRKELQQRINIIIERLKAIKEPHLYISASATFFECIGKLGIDPNAWSNNGIYLVEDALSSLQQLPTGNEQECYKALQCYGNLFLGVAHIGQVDKLTLGHINYVHEAFAVAKGLTTVWYKGRGMAAFLTVLGLIGLPYYATDMETNHLQELVNFLHVNLENHDHVNKKPNEYVFSILLTINSIGLLDKLEYLEYKRDWITVATRLIEKLPIELKAIFYHYYLSTIENLGASKKLSLSPQEHLTHIIDQLATSKDHELNYMGYTYCVDIAHKLNALSVIPESMIDSLIENIATQYDFDNGHQPENLFYRSGFMRAAYALIAASQMGCIEKIFQPSGSKGAPLIEAILTNHHENWGASDESFTVLNHALIDLALSQRGTKVEASLVDKNVVLHETFSKFFARQSRPARTQRTSLHAYFPGMNSRRHYANISRELYERGNSHVRNLFEQSAEILNKGLPKRKTHDVSRFFFDRDIAHDSVADKWNFIGSSMTVYNLALLEHLKTSAKEVRVGSVGGESYGMIAAAIASNAVSLEDGLKIANKTLGAIYDFAHTNNLGTWHIASLSGKTIQSALKTLINRFPLDVAIFRWQTLSTQKEEVHLYIKDTALAEANRLIDEEFSKEVLLTEFKKPTIEIVHSPLLAPVRINISNFMIEENIVFKNPDIPIVANNGTGTALTHNDVRELVLDMVNLPMYSAQSFHSFDEMAPAKTNVIVEFGYGQKTQKFISEHNVKQPFFEFYGGNNKLYEIITEIRSIKTAAHDDFSLDEFLSKTSRSTELTI